MEKVIYLLSKDNTVSGEHFRDSLINDFAPTISAIAESIQINVVDDAVALASLKRAGPEAADKLSGPPIADGILFLWLKSVSLAKQVESSLKKFTESFYGYLVTESEVMPNTTTPTSPPSRTKGFDQVALLRKPEKLAYSDWLYNWQGLHTQVAIDTQSTCRYTQNVIVRPLTPGALDIQAIVEEGYPDEAAMYDPMVFYNANGDSEKMAAHIQLMMESCSRFIDFDARPCDMMGMSQYVVKR